MQHIAIAARHDMVQLTVLNLKTPTGHTVAYLKLVHVSMLIAMLTDLVRASRTPLVALSTAQYPPAAVYPTYVVTRLDMDTGRPKPDS